MDLWASCVAQLVKNLPAMRETSVRSLGWDDPLEKGKATYSSVLAWRIPWTLWSWGSQRVRHYWATFTYTQVDLHNSEMQSQLWRAHRHWAFPGVLSYFYFMYLSLPVLGLHCCAGFSLVAVSRDCSSYGAPASYCGRFSCCGARALGCMGFSSCGFWALRHRLSSCGTQAYLLWSI